MAARPLWRRIARLAVISVAVVIVLVALAVGLLHTRWGKAWVRGRVEHRLAETFRGGATLGSLDYGFLFSDVELGDLTINDAAGRPAIRIGSLRAELDRGSLVNGTPVIEDLAITGLHVALVEGADRRSNLVGLTAPSDRKPLASITVRALSVAGTATLTKLDGTVVTVADLSLTGGITARPAAKELDVALGPVAAKVTIDRPGAPRRELEVAIASTALAHRGIATDVEAHQVVLGAVSLAAARGRVEIAGGRLVGAPSLALDQLRVDHHKLQTLLGRTVLVDDVVGDATLAGPIEALVAHGAFTLRSTTLTLDGTLDLSNRLRPRYQLALAGKGRSEDLLVVASSKLPSIATDIRIGVDGQGTTLADLEAAVTLDLGATTIGAVAVEGLSAKLVAKRGAFSLERFAAHGLGFELSATGEIAADTTLRGRLTATGEPDEAVAVLRAAGIELPGKLPPLPRLALVATAAGKVDGSLALQLEPVKLAFAGGSIDAAGAARLEQRVVVDASTTIVLRGLDLARLATLAGRPARLRGTLGGTLALHRTPTSRRADYAAVVALPEGVVHARGQVDRTSLTTTARLVRDGLELGQLTATLPLDERRLAPTRPWHVTFAVPRRAVAELAALVPPQLRARLAADPGAEVELRADLRGTPRAPRGTIDATLTGARHGELHATLAPGASGIVVTTTGEVGSEALAAVLHGTITVPSPVVGRRFVLDPQRLTIDETVELAERPLAELPSLPPALVALGGTVGGRLHVIGTPRALTVDGSAGWRGYRTASGGPGETTLALVGSPTKLTATITHGRAVSIVADLTRGDDRIDLRARAHADETPLLPLLPAFGALSTGPLARADLGRLRWNMSLDLGLATHGTVLTLDRASVDGSLAIRGGAFAIPDSTRRWHDIALELSGDPHGVRLTSLELRESDRQLAERRFHASGLLTLDGLRATKLALALEAKDWLLLGLTSPVLGDAPTAALDLKARVDADLTTPIPAIDVIVDALDLKAPDRHDRAHQPERASVAGDVIFVDATTPVGKLPAIAPQGPLRGARPLDLRVHLPNPVHINRAPLDVVAQGELAISVRPERTIPRGEVTLLSGSINLFAYDHALVRGRISVSEEHPRGWLDLEFERRLPDGASRDLAHPERGAHLTLTGEPSKPRLTISGAASATIPEVFVMYNAGHSLYTPRPGLPATSTVLVPRGDQTNMLGFVSLALPHLLFLDRVTAWADASEPRGAYGRIRNLEADRYTAGERNRVRAIARPTTPGRSTAELQLDHVWLHDARKALGIGVRVGDRLGGGVGLIFEWSSKP